MSLSLCALKRRKIGSTHSCSVMGFHDTQLLKLTLLARGGTRLLRIITGFQSFQYQNTSIFISPCENDFFLLLETWSCQEAVSQAGSQSFLSWYYCIASIDVPMLLGILPVVNPVQIISIVASTTRVFSVNGFLRNLGWNSIIRPFA